MLSPVSHALSFIASISPVSTLGRYVQYAHNNPMVVQRIEKLEHPSLEAKFHEVRRKLESGASDCSMMQLFHGTGTAGIEGITNNGFRLPERSENNMFGRGVYFATDSSKSANPLYTKGSNALLLCDVMLGKSCTIDSLCSRHPLRQHVKNSSKGRPYLDVEEADVRKAGFDSVYARRDGNMASGGVKFDEMIVYDPHQALPRYIVHFSSAGPEPVNAKWGTNARSLCGGGMVWEVKATKLPQLGAESQELFQFNFAVGQLYRLLKTQAIDVEQVDVYNSPVVKSTFEKKKAEFEAKGHGEEIWVFHGTGSGETVATICSEGFKVAGKPGGPPIANGAAHGHGVYSAKGPKTPMNYGSSSRSVILCLALPGKKGAQEREDSWEPKDDWIVFKTGEQLLPKYVVHWR